MPRVETHPLFYARLHLELLRLQESTDVEVEYIGHHLAAVEERVQTTWDELPRDSADATVRYVTGVFESIQALFVIEARLVADDELISIRNIRIIAIPES